MTITDIRVSSPAGRPSTLPGRQVNVVVRATDPISRVGLLRMLHATEGVCAAVECGATWLDVAVVAAVRFDVELAEVLRRMAAETSAPVVLIIDQYDRDLLQAAECDVAVVLPRRRMTAQLLAGALRALCAQLTEGSKAFRDGARLYPEHVCELRKEADSRWTQFETTSLREVGVLRLSGREARVLRLVAEGEDTARIAEILHYSESTVKNIVYELISRFNVKNRTHAVAYAIREGLI